jgi:hypothetical protein
MNDLVRALCLAKWESSGALAKSLIASPELARSTAEKLIDNTGWRERVTAAKLIAAFELNDLVPALLTTFEKNPEEYTCRAFSRLAVQSLGHHAVIYLAKMKQACPDNDYGRHLQELIEQQT